MTLDAPQFVLGFKALHDQIPDIVGDPLENERWGDDGNSLQATSKGLLVWRKADNWTAFTDGYQTWVNGPNGIQVRLNTERFTWEADYVAATDTYAPRLLNLPLAPLSDRYPYLVAPIGFILHGTRSGLSRPASEEFPAAAQYEAVRTDGVGAVCTIGDDVVAQHVPWDRWVWHARGASRYYVGCELAQGTVSDEITDAQVRALCWVVGRVRSLYPSIPLSFPTHAELDGTPMYNAFDGKTDVFPREDPRTEELRSRIMARLAEIGIK